MSLSLVEPDNLATIYKAHVTDIAAMARKFADDIEAGEYGIASRALVILEREDGLAIFGWGEGSISIRGLLSDFGSTFLLISSSSSLSLQRPAETCTSPLFVIATAPYP